MSSGLDKDIVVKCHINIIEERESVFGSDYKRNSKIEGTQVVHLKSGGPAQSWTITIPYQLRHRDERSIWGREYYLYNIDKEDPASCDYEFARPLPSTADLRRLVAENGDKPLPNASAPLAPRPSAPATPSRSSGSLAMVDAPSDAYAILDRDNTAVHVSTLVDHSNPDGCISIDADDVGEGAYVGWSFRAASGRTGSGRFDDSGDGFETAACLEAGDFPVTLLVRYGDDDGDEVTASVRLNTHGTYTVRYY